MEGAGGTGGRSGARGGAVGDGDDSTNEGKSASSPHDGWNAALDLGSMYSMEKRSGIHTAWSRGDTGHGITVALIDTGIAPVPGLDGDDKVVDGPDLSFEGQAPTMGAPRRLRSRHAR